MQFFLNLLSLRAPMTCWPYSTEQAKGLGHHPVLDVCGRLRCQPAYIWVLLGDRKWQTSGHEATTAAPLCRTPVHTHHHCATSSPCYSFRLSKQGLFVFTMIRFLPKTTKNVKSSFYFHDYLINLGMKSFKKKIKYSNFWCLKNILKSSSLITSCYSSNFDLITILDNYIGW